MGLGMTGWWRGCGGWPGPAGPGRLFSLMAGVVLLLAGCGAPPPEEPAAPTAATALEPVPWEEVAGEFTREAGLEKWAEALEGSAAYYAKRPPTAPYRFGPDTVTAGALARGCQDLAAVARQGDATNLARHLAAHYRLYRSAANGESGVLVTGYYEPLLHGSRKPDQRFRHPLYRRPPDLLQADLGEFREQWKGEKLVARLEGGRLKPYHDRTAIDGGRLAGQGLELVWVDDPIALFFLHIQGSGRVRLADGSFIRVGYDGANGQPYRSIGKVLIDEGRLPAEGMSLPVLRRWLEEHPGEATRVLHANPSYVFFQEQSGGPFGNIMVPLTAEGSIATDHRLFPKGAPALLVSELPDFAPDGETVERWRPVRRLVVNQDTGGAIRGVGRVDWFMGYGTEAERRAGAMKQGGGRLYFVAPRAG